MVQQPPATSGIELANWYWKVVRQYVSERCGVSLSRSSCLNYLHRLGFAFNRPKKRLLKADAEKREAFVAEYAALREEAGRTGARILFADEAHFRADAELRGKWVLRGEPALVDSTSPRYGEKASYYSAVCLETGEVDWMELDGNSNSGTSVAFLMQLRERHSGPLNVIWDNAPAHRGEAMREYLRTPGLGMRLVNLPGYSPDFNADEAIWGWAREEATGNLCLGSKEAVEERVGKFLSGLTTRKDEVKRRCRTVLQSRAETFLRNSRPGSQHSANAHPWLWFRRWVRPPRCGGILPDNRLSGRFSSVTRPLASVVMPCHSPGGRSLSQLVLFAQFEPSVALYSATSVARSDDSVGDGSS